MMYDAYQAWPMRGPGPAARGERSRSILEAWSSQPFALAVRARWRPITKSSRSPASPMSGPIRDVDSVEVGGETREVERAVATATPFCKLLHFHKEGGADDPKVLLVAPMSGHFATLLRGTLRTMLRDHQVYLTDWINPRNVKLEAGRFGLEDYTQHLIDFVGFIGEDSHVVAVCQPTVSALRHRRDGADGANVQPASLTLMAGPIDTRIAPTKVNELAKEKPIEWFRDNLIGVVPAKFAGHGRRVYPGFLQLSAFMSMNAERHAKSFVELFQHRVAGDFEKADAIRNSTRNISPSWT